MCGFAGFLRFGDTRFDEHERRAILVRMGRLLAHRGPDDQTFYDDGVLSLVFRRLSIVDLAGGEQPIFNERGDQFIVVNGEIYNHAELRRQLAPRHTFSTRSDSEAPLHLFEEQGTAALDGLRGMFALAIWNRQTQRLFLARDRLGIKPLYVCRLPHGLLFGSELKALLAHPDCPREVDWSELLELGPQQRARVPTYVRGIDHLPGGHYLTAQAGRIETVRWWQIDDHLASAPFGDNLLAYRNEFERLTEESTLEHLLGDVPIGLHLSGGVDSSLLAAIVAREKHDLACFSVVEYATWRSGDVAAARLVTEQLRLPWHPVLFERRALLDQMQFDLRRLEQSVHMMDSPRFDPEWILKEELHRYARRSCPGLKVVLLGQGIDEFAGGYSRQINSSHGSWKAYIDDEVEPDLRYWCGVEAALPERLRDLSREPAVDAKWSPYHRKMRTFVYQLQHFNLWHEDRTSASQSLEARVPFLDHRIVELLASVPEPLQPYLFWNKRIVRDMIGRRLPAYDVERPKIPFFLAGDTRSIDAMLNGMLARCVPDFLDKYGDLAELPFSRDALHRMSARVLGNQQTSQGDSWRLMECMAIAIFARQCTLPDADEFDAVRARTEGAPLMRAEQWAEMDAAFADSVSEPAIVWHSSDRIALPRGARIVVPLGHEESFELTSSSGARSMISVPQDMAWVPALLRHLGNPASESFTIQDWADEFEIDAGTLHGALETLYLAGFVVRVPDSVES